MFIHQNMPKNHLSNDISRSVQVNSQNIGVMSAKSV